MCIALSLPQKCQHLIEFVHVPVLVETLLYSSSERKALIALDMIVQNTGSDPAWLLLTHIDNVEGRLATEDWFPSNDSDCDDRMRIVSQVYGARWTVDRRARRLDFVPPFEGTFEEPAERIEALALSFGSTFGGGCVDAAFVEAESALFGTYRLRQLPEVKPPHVVLDRPYSTFCLGPIPKKTTLFARITIVIVGAAYARLVHQDTEAPFEVFGANVVCERIRESLRPESWHPGFAKYFDANIATGDLEPDRCYVVIAQPGADKLVRYRPACARIPELPISDEVANERALWLNAFSQDFRLILKYEPQPSSSNHSPRRPLFSRRLPRSVGIFP